MSSEATPGDDLRISFSDDAVAKLHEVIAAYPEPLAGLRLKILGRSASGFEHVLTMVEEGTEPDDDPAIEVSGLRVYVEADNAQDLNGVSVHYRDKGPNESGLEFSNPNPIWRDPLALEIQNLFDEYVNPGVASHGGHVSLIDVRDNKAYIQLGGGCQGCGMADVTLKQGIEVAIKEAVPSIEEVVDVTDHDAGDNPYYQPAKK